MKVGINGFGRIGRCILRAYLELLVRNNNAAYYTNVNKSHVYTEVDYSVIEIVAINSTTNNAEKIAHFLKYDSIHGMLNFPICTDENCIYIQYDIVANHNDNNFIINDNFNKSKNSKILKINLLNYKDPSDIPWKKYDVDVVFECTGMFNDIDQASKHFSNKHNDNVKLIIVSAPCNGVDYTIVLGVNDDSETMMNIRNNILYANNITNIISIGSCTTNCLAPLVMAIHQVIGIQSGFMTSIHSYTNDQRLLDSNHDDNRRSRAAALSLIPTSTGAAKSIGKIIPELNGKIDGSAIRVPTPNVSAIDFKFYCNKSTTKEEINKIMRDASGLHPTIISIVEEELVSIDFNHTTFSCIFDTTQTKVINGNFCRVLAWYDNEWGFANRMLDLTLKLIQ